ncbi:Imm52 family immunity protein [Brevundimonas sp. UBA7664]|uniref:Imm52 family immunity protein n=1 Tax=Brevundimonas sp. UBA7664 TaxID=1946141 RepID=UPI0039C873B7
MTTILVGVYWGVRAELLERAAARLHDHFGALSSTSEHLTHWYLRASRKPKIPTPVDTASADALATLLAQGVNRRDTDKTVIAELGWGIGLWNGSSGPIEASTSILCNCTSPRVTNSALVEVSADGIEPLSVQRAEELLKRLVDIWEPDEGIVSRSIWLAVEGRQEETELARWKAQ